MENKNTKILIILVAILIVLVLGVIAYLVYDKISEDDSAPTNINDVDNNENNATEENVQEILQEIERMYGQNIENLLKKEHLVYKIVLEIKERIPNISNLQISKTLGINKNIIYKIIK